MQYALCSAISDYCRSSLINLVVELFFLHCINMCACMRVWVCTNVNTGNDEKVEVVVLIHKYFTTIQMRLQNQEKILDSKISIQ